VASATIADEPQFNFPNRCKIPTAIWPTRRATQSMRRVRHDAREQTTNKTHEVLWGVPSPFARATAIIKLAGKICFTSLTDVAQNVGVI
jgi:hypothetical protein